MKSNGKILYLCEMLGLLLWNVEAKSVLDEQPDIRELNLDDDDILLDLLQDEEEFGSDLNEPDVQGLKTELSLDDDDMHLDLLQDEEEYGSDYQDAYDNKDANDEDGMSIPGMGNRNRTFFNGGKVEIIHNIGAAGNYLDKEHGLENNLGILSENIDIDETICNKLDKVIVQLKKKISNLEKAKEKYCTERENKRIEYDGLKEELDTV